MRATDEVTSEGATGRTLPYDVGGDVIPTANMTVAKCTAACKAAGYILAGVEYSGECCKCCWFNISWFQKKDAF